MLKRLLSLILIQFFVCSLGPLPDALALAPQSQLHVLPESYPSYVTGSEGPISQSQNVTQLEDPFDPFSHSQAELSVAQTAEGDELSIPILGQVLAVGLLGTSLGVVLLGISPLYLLIPVLGVIALVILKGIVKTLLTIGLVGSAGVLYLIGSQWFFVPLVVLAFFLIFVRLSLQATVSEDEQQQSQENKSLWSKLSISEQTVQRVALVSGAMLLGSLALYAIFNPAFWPIFGLYSAGLVLILIPSMIIHEMAHAGALKILGDKDSAKKRLTLNPKAHMSKNGIQAVRYNPENIDTPEKLRFAAAAGPLANLFLSTVFLTVALILTLVVPGAPLLIVAAAVLGFEINAFLGLFNLMPLSKDRDGYKVFHDWQHPWAKALKYMVYGSAAALPVVLGLFALLMGWPVLLGVGFALGVLKVDHSPASNWDRFVKDQQISIPRLTESGDRDLMTATYSYIRLLDDFEEVLDVVFGYSPENEQDLREKLTAVLQEIQNWQAPQYDPNLNIQDQQQAVLSRFEEFNQRLQVILQSA